MRSLENHVEGESFDAVSSLFTSMGYFEADADLSRTIAGVAWALRPNGLFILILNPEQVARGLVEQEVKEAGGYTFTIHRRIADGWIEKSIQYADPNREHQHHVERVRRCRQMAGVSSSSVRASSSRPIMAIMPGTLGAKTLRAVYLSLENHVVSRFHIVADCPA